MRALDTNVVVRFLVQDDATQSARAARLVDRAVEADERLFLSDVVLCEVVWVLTSSYRLPRAEVVVALRQLVRARHVATSDPDRVRRALDAYDRGKGDFADYMIREHARAVGCAEVVTFDKALLAEAGFAAP